MSSRISLDPQYVSHIKDASLKLTGPKKRAFMAKVTIELLDSSPRRAERHFGWNRNTVILALRELREGFTYQDQFHLRGNKKSEEKNPQLKADILSLVEPESAVDPEFKSPFKFTRITAKALRKALLEQKHYTNEELPKEWALGKILNRLGYKLKGLRKSIPKKKFQKQTRSSRISPKPVKKQRSLKKS